MSAEADTSSAPKRDGDRRKWRNRQPTGKRLDLTPEEAERRGQERLEKQAREFISVRMTRAEKATLTKRANAYGMSVSEFTRTVLLSGLKEPPPPRTDPAAVRELAFQISKIGTNFNQYIARVNEAKQIALDKQLQTLLGMEGRVLEVADEIAGALAHVIEL